MRAARCGSLVILLLMSIPVSGTAWSQAALRHGTAHVEVTRSYDKLSDTFDLAFLPAASTYGGSNAPFTLVWSTGPNPVAGSGGTDSFLVISGPAGSIGAGTQSPPSGALSLSFNWYFAQAKYVVPFSTDNAPNADCAVETTTADAAAFRGTFRCSRLPGPFERDGYLVADGDFVASTRPVGAATTGGGGGGAGTIILVVAAIALLGAGVLFLRKRRPSAPPPVPPPPSVAPGWYPDPYGEARLRYHDGTNWTPSTSA